MFRHLSTNFNVRIFWFLVLESLTKANLYVSLKTDLRFQLFGRQRMPPYAMIVDCE